MNRETPFGVRTADKAMLLRVTAVRHVMNYNLPVLRLVADRSRANNRAATDGNMCTMHVRLNSIINTRLQRVQCYTGYLFSIVRRKPQRLEETAISTLKLMYNILKD